MKVNYVLVNRTSESGVAIQASRQDKEYSSSSFAKQGVDSQTSSSVLARQVLPLRQYNKTGSSGFQTALTPALQNPLQREYSVLSSLMAHVKTLSAFTTYKPASL